ncbi:hypothetical protein [Paracoccus cavernae]|uniref:hypothetical protein n=1 Tax=Paracoccus cavernae TaxID=1571207 RepID=UPI003644AA64
MDYTHIITLTAPQAAFTRNIADLMVVTSEHGAWLYGATHIGGGSGPSRLPRRIRRSPFSRAQPIASPRPISTGQGSSC